MFSTRYARARLRGEANPIAYPALNLALDGCLSRWVMHEHHPAQISRTASSLVLGNSRVQWEGDGLRWLIDEPTAPRRGRVRGEIRILPETLNRRAFSLDRGAKHRWWPIAPRSRIEVDLSEPRLRWAGDAYLDSNWGDEPLGACFAGWHWSRSTAEHSTKVFYVTESCDSEYDAWALEFDGSGDAQPCRLPPMQPLPLSSWGLKREIASDSASETRLVRTLLDSPFYARQHAEHRVDGSTILAVHETLNLQRFGKRWVQTLLPFRTSRAR